MRRSRTLLALALTTSLALIAGLPDPQTLSLNSYPRTVLPGSTVTTLLQRSGPWSSGTLELVFPYAFNLRLIESSPTLDCVVLSDRVTCPVTGEAVLRVTGSFSHQGGDRVWLASSTDPNLSVQARTFVSVTGPKLVYLPLLEAARDS